jgi:hypothetical protein
MTLLNVEMTMPDSACVKNLAVHYTQIIDEIREIYPPEEIPGMSPPEEIPGMYPPEEIRGMFPPEEIRGMFPPEEIPEMYPREEILEMSPPEEIRGTIDLLQEETTGIGTGHVTCMVIRDHVTYVWFLIEVFQVVMVKEE